jgi:Flp pilus assembly protein TadG
MTRVRLFARLRALRRSESGLAAIEMALMAPTLALLLLGGYDMSRFISVRSGVDKVGFSVADVTSQYTQLPEAAMTQIFRVTGASLKDYRSGENGVTVLTSVYLDGVTPRVRWQCYSSNGTAWASKVGAAGGPAAVEPALLADANDNLIVSEVFYRFEPLFMTFFKNDFDLHTQSIYRPRLGALTVNPCP